MFFFFFFSRMKTKNVHNTAKRIAVKMGITESGRVGSRKGKNQRLWLTRPKSASFLERFAQNDAAAER